MKLYEKDEKGKDLFLQDLMKVIHGVSAREINKIEGKTGRTVCKAKFLRQQFAMTDIGTTQHITRLTTRLKQAW